MASNVETLKQLVSTALLLVEIFWLYIKCLWTIFFSTFYLLKPRTKDCVRGDIVLVTGAGHGIGRELAKKYASEGATVVCWDINKNNNEETTREIVRMGYPKPHAYVCDVTLPRNVSEVAKKVQNEVGDVTILVNNAGVAYIKTLIDSDIKEIEHTIQVNTISHFWTLKAFLPGMIRRNRGHIVALCSIAGLFGGKNGTAYCASKFAVRGIMEALYQELRADSKSNIRCTTIYPAGVDTGIFKKVFVRFPKLLPIISPQEAAAIIETAQRQNLVELSIPTYNLFIHNLFRLFPIKAQDRILDFCNTQIVE